MQMYFEKASLLSADFVAFLAIHEKRVASTLAQLQSQFQKLPIFEIGSKDNKCWSSIWDRVCFIA